MEKPILVNLLLLTILLSSFGNLNASNSNPKSEVEFLIADVEDIKSFAANDGKLILLHFTASWCMPCQWMEKNTYKNEHLAHFVNENYLAKKIDIDDFEGRKLKDHYKVKTLPSILVFNPQGKLLDRINEAIEAEELLNVLSLLNTGENKRTSEVSTIEITYTNQEYISAPSINISPQIQMPMIPDFEAIEEKEDQGHLPIPDMELEKAKENKKQIASSYKPINTSLINEVDYTTKRREAYSVQIGVFSTRARAQKFMTEHKKKLIEPIQIIPEVRGLSTFYKVLVGEFNKEFDALRYKTHLNSIGIESIVKKN